MANRTYYDSPFGIAVFPHLNRPDAKFNPQNPLFKTGLRLSGGAAQGLKSRIDIASQAAFDDFMENGDGAKLTPGERKKFEVYYPYTVEEDDEGNPTGDIVFDFKQNAVIHLRDGTTKEIKIGLYDAAGKEMDKLIRGGSEIRVNYSMRPIPMKSLKQVGVRLDFGRVQVKTLAQGNAGGFGAVDGYEDDGEPQSGGFGSADESPASGNADY